MSTQPKTSISVGQSRKEHFAVIFETCHRPLLAYVIRRSNSVADAQDITSMAFEILWRKLETLPADAEPLLWLYGVARRCLANQYRRIETRERHQGAISREGSVSPPGFSDEDEDAQIVRNAISQLSPPDQEILRLSAWEELSHANIGVVLSISENAVSIRIYRARKRLREKLLPHFPNLESSDDS